MYDTKTGKRFDMNHPVWIEHNKTKKGEVSKRLLGKKVVELEQAGLVTLVPSVTEIAKVADGFGAFSAGAYWGMGLGVDAAIEVGSGQLDLSAESWHDKAITHGKGVMAKPRDIGSELHDIYDQLTRGKVRKEQLNPQQDAFCEAIGAAVRRYSLDGVSTETQYSDEGAGGTTDLVGHGPKGVEVWDWKTCKDERPVRKSEILQICRYCWHYKAEVGRLWYWNQKTSKWCANAPVTFDAKAIAFGNEVFERGLALFHGLKDLGLLDMTIGEGD
jgi:hypothetical protein